MPRSQPPEPASLRAQPPNPAPLRNTEFAASCGGTGAWILLARVCFGV